MLPTDEECEAIMKAKAEQDGLPLGQAEQFLVTLSAISHLKPRLELWLFKLDYEQNEKEIAEPLNDLKQAVIELINCKTLRYILSVLLSIGNFLNGSTARGFTLDYLGRLPEVKDTKYKNSLLHHVFLYRSFVYFVSYSDLHSELGALCRCHRVDWDELPKRLEKLETDSKRSWEHYRLIFSSEKESNKNINTIKAFYELFILVCSYRTTIIDGIWREKEKVYEILRIEKKHVIECMFNTL
ncbi:unnamed protein product [Schistosoma mattheei]|uniref:Uncharacterized protein n=1 Tax=Schistosoma mattheei TaxID=31246 RepID=A0A183NII3_9TREM|nr:unnamed protein product [Schistosoma mattheei]